MNEEQTDNISMADNDIAASRTRTAVLEYIDAMDSGDPIDDDDDDDDDVVVDEQTVSTEKRNSEKADAWSTTTPDETLNKRRMRTSVALSQADSLDKGMTPEVTEPTYFENRERQKSIDDTESLEARQTSKLASSSSASVPSGSKNTKHRTSSRTSVSTATDGTRDMSLSNATSTGSTSTSTSSNVVPIQGAGGGLQRQQNVTYGLDGPGAYNIASGTRIRRVGAGGEGRDTSMGEISFLTREPSRQQTAHHEDLPIAAVLAPIEDSNEDHGDGQDRDERRPGDGGTDDNDDDDDISEEPKPVQVAQVHSENFSSMVNSSPFQRFLAVIALFIVCVAGIVITLIFVLQRDSSGNSANNNNVLPTTPSPVVAGAPTPSPVVTSSPTESRLIRDCIADTATLERAIRNDVGYVELCPGILVIEPTTAGATSIDFQQREFYISCQDKSYLTSVQNTPCTIDMKEYTFTNVGGNSDLSFEGILFTTTSTETGLTDHTVFDMTGGEAWFLYCEFSDLAVGSNRGAAVRLSLKAGVDFEECLFARNIVEVEGGAVWLSHGSGAKFINCTFEENESNEVGGALYVERNSYATIEAGQFVGNYAFDSGGAIYSYASDVTLDDGVIFIDNEVDTNFESTDIYSEHSYVQCDETTLAQNPAPDAIQIVYEGDIPPTDVCR